MATHTGNNTLSNLALILGGKSLVDETIAELLLDIINQWRDSQYVVYAHKLDGCRVLLLELAACSVTWDIKIEACPAVGNPYLDLRLFAISDSHAKPCKLEIPFDCHDSFNRVYEALGV